MRKVNNEELKNKWEVFDILYFSDRDERDSEQAKQKIYNAREYGVEFFLTRGRATINTQRYYLLKIWRPINEEPSQQIY